MGRRLTNLLALERVAPALLAEHDLTDHGIRTLAAETVAAAA